MMNISRKARLVSLAAVAAIGFSFAAPSVQAAEGEVEPIHVDWSFEGMFGTYDRDALRRGYKVYKEVCAVCHSMEYVKFRNLAEPGGPEFSEGQVKALAAEITVVDGPDSAGDMYERPGEPKDAFPSPYPNPEASAAALGAAAPDLSLMTKARPGGPDYVYSLLMGYEEAPEGFELTTGSYNLYFPGHQIAMPPPLSDGQVDYEDGTPNTVDQMAKDVTHFMMWTAEPKLEQRHRMGFQVLLYLVALTGILYFTMRKVWADAH
ncbi:cytochrome c1 [Parvibaculum lavamentivorans DS-1]|uniref:Cytochrome c1 n=2 Tax=Parvibaculum lavamentivorans TaxID=256618 RepID=A7HVC5_PARL1|nr:cytochrome c1 [Parvibaculum lavamentivorans DS-1]